MWVPRYIISLTVFGLSIAVYMYVELKFRAFSAAARRASTLSTSTAQAELGLDSAGLQSLPNTIRNDRRPSGVSLRMPNFTKHDDPVVEPTPEDPNTREVNTRNNDEGDQLRKENPKSASRKQSVCTASTTFTSTSEKSSSCKPANTSSFPGNLGDSSVGNILVLQPTLEQIPLPQSDCSAPTNSTHRRQLRSQLRLIFIYPMVYVALWIPPMVLNILQYFPRYQSSIPSGLAITATLCLTLMGFIDCVVFLWREKPWHRGARSHELVPSVVKKSSCFKKRRHNSDSGGDIEAVRPCSLPISNTNISGQTTSYPARQSVDRQGSQNTFTSQQSSRFRSPTFSLRSSSETRSKARQQAYERLALERDSQTVDSGLSRGSQVNRLSIGSQPSTLEGRTTHTSGTGRKEWWDRRQSVWSRTENETVHEG